MIYISDGMPIIGINSLHHPNRQRFSIGHEIGHLVLHRNSFPGKSTLTKNSESNCEP
jgi:Zn-dependent peptidase ImmA (M78 family)